MIKTVVAQKVTSSQGVSKKNGRSFTKFGLQDAQGIWYNTFTDPGAVEGGEYKIEFEEGQYGNDLKSIEPVKETENRTANKNRNSSIVRQHSQEMALRYLVAQGKSFSLDDVKEITDWFDEDVKSQEMPF